MNKTIHILPVTYGKGANQEGCEGAPRALLAAGLRKVLSRPAAHTRIQLARPHSASGSRWTQLAILLRQHGQHVESVVRGGHLPFVIGGDHSIAAGTWRGVARGLKQAPGLLWIDAHLDAHTPETSHSGNPHGMPLAALLGHGNAAMGAKLGACLDPQRVAIVGLRSYEAEEKALIDALGVRCYEMTEIARRGLPVVMREALLLVRGANQDGAFGISLDVDALDPSQAPAVSTPEAGGLDSAQLAEALHGVVNETGFCGLELCEYNPFYDPQQRTCQLLLQLLTALFADKSAACIALEHTHGAHNYAPQPRVLCRGEGSYLWDVNGNRYIDFMSAYSAVSFGHAHPRLVAAMADQAARLAVTSRAFHNDRLPLLLQRLTRVFGMDKALPMNTGMEAVETALKAARKWGEKVKGIPAGQGEIIACEGNFHGRSIAIVGLSSEAQYRDGFAPFPAGTKLVPFGDAAALEAAITPLTAAFLVEPIQGEGGIRVPPPGYLKSCMEICRRHHVLLIADEVQTGMGRTGELLACMHEGVKPDGLCLGKALGGGLLPVSAFLAREEVMAVFTPGDHGSTFGGNALSAAVALEALALLEEEDLCARSAALGEHVLHRLRAQTLPGVVDIRGRGLLIGIELDPHQLDAHSVCEALAQRGLLTRETHATVIRIAPPLNIPETVLNHGITVLLEVLGAGKGHLRRVA